jgi:hypothetical protein
VTDPSPSPRPAAKQSHDERRRRRVRALPWLLSTAVHVAVLAWWASLPEPPPRVVQADPDLRAIELVELPPVIEVEPEPPRADEPPRTDEPPSADEPPTAPVDRAVPRRPTGPRLPSEPTGPEVPSEPTGPEVPSEPGGVAIVGLRDGSRSSSTGPSLRPSLPPPRVGRGHVVREVGAEGPPASTSHDGKPRSFAEAGFRTRRNGTQVFRDATGRFTATLGADGRIKFKDMPVTIARDPMTGAMKGIGMPGLAEGLRAASGQELYIQEKRRLLEETFELRLQLAIGHARDKVDRRLKSLYRELLEQWQDEGESAADRRAALFQRWDECEEGLPVALPGFSGAASSELDDLRRSAGEQARDTIERFIQRQLPAGSPQAYTDEELRHLNAKRRSRARFAPY